MSRGSLVERALASSLIEGRQRDTEHVITATGKLCRVCARPMHRQAKKDAHQPCVKAERARGGR